MSRTKNATRNIIWGFVNKVVMLLGPFNTRTVIIRYLGANYLGLGSLFNSILHILNLTELGFASAVVFSLYKPIAENDTDSICALMNLYRKIYRYIGGIILTAGIGVMFFLPMIIKSDIPPDINLYSLYVIYLLNTVFSYWLFAYKSSLLIAHQRNDVTSNINTVGFSLQYVLQITFLIITKNYYAYMILVLLFTIGRNIAISVIVDRKYPDYKCRGDVSKEQINGIKKRVSGLFVQKICSATRNTFDSIVISAYLGLTIVGLYDNYFYIISAVHKLLDVILVSIRSGIGNSIVLESKEKNFENFSLFNFMYSWISGVCAVCLVALTQTFMKIWVGSDYTFSNGIMMLFCVYFYSLTMIDIRTVYDDAAGIWWSQKYVVIVEAVLNIVLNFILGKFFGVIGIVSATIISIVFVNFIAKTKYIFKLYFTEQKISSYFLVHIKWVVLVVIASIIVWFSTSRIPLEGWPGFAVYGIIAFFVSNATFVLFNFKNKYFKPSLRMMVRIKNIFKR